MPRPYNTTQNNATHCNTLQQSATHFTALYHTAPHCTTLQHTATHCNTLQHTATISQVIEYAATVPEFYDAINILVQNDPDVLNKTMSFLLTNPALLSFPSKVAYLRLQIEDSFPSASYGGYHSEACNLLIERGNLARTLVQQLLRLEQSEIRTRHLQVRFVGEEGMGTGVCV